MKRHVIGKDASRCSFAGDFLMRRKIIIRIRRKNEFNWCWAFLIILAILLGIFSLEVETATEIVIILFGFSVLMVLATLYQGFEVIKE